MSIPLWQHIQKSKQTAFIPIPTLTPTPTPYPINYHDKLSFTVSSGNNTGPIFTKGSLDPFDVAPNKPQTLRVYISCATPVASVAALWQTDTKEELVPFKLAEGTATRGWWEGRWIATDTYWYKLNIHLIADDGKTKNSAYMTWR